MGGIFDTLRHDRTGKLLEAHGEVSDPRSLFLNIVGKVEEQESADESEPMQQGGKVSPGLVQCIRNGFPVGLRDRYNVADVGPVDGKHGKDLGQSSVAARLR